jgi:1,4-alpha-glucan branching enzyme
VQILQTARRGKAAEARKGPALSDHDAYLFREGTHVRLYNAMGCHLVEDGARFRVWAPNAERVSVIGDFNRWDLRANALDPRSDGSGIWETFVPGVAHGTAYKFRIVGKDGYEADKADPFAFFAEAPPLTASRAWSLDYEWNDGEWMSNRRARNALDAPMSTYEMHLGSWRRKAPAVTDHRAPVLWVVGLPDHRLLRADRALRNAAGLHVPRRYAAPAWRWCDPRLGSVPLSDRCAWTRLL